MKKTILNIAAIAVIVATSFVACNNKQGNQTNSSNDSLSKDSATLSEKIETLADSANSKIKETATEAKTEIKDAAQSAKEGVKDAASDIKEGAKDVKNDIKKSVE